MDDYTLIGASLLFWSTIGAVVFLIFRRLRIKLILLIFSTVAIIAFDIPVGYFYYSSLCEESAGQKLYKAVKASGYIAKGEVPFGCSGGPCDLKLSTLYEEGKELYLEGRVISDSESGMAPEKGMYRFYLAKLDSKDCDYYKKEILEKRPMLERKYLPDGMCIASAKIEKYSTPYQYERTIESIFIKNIIKERSGLINIETGEILAESSSYRYYFGWFYRKFALGLRPFSDHASCYGGNKPPNDFYTGIIDKSFLPNID